MRICSSFAFTLAILLSSIAITTPSFSDVKCSISNDFFDATPVGNKKCYPGKKDSVRWEIRTFEKGSLWAISALIIADGDFVLNSPSNIRNAFDQIPWVKNKSPKFQRMAKSTVKTGVFQRYTRVYSTSLDNWASDCFAFISFRTGAHDDNQRPNGAFRAIVCNKANTGFSDELMDEISMRFSISRYKTSKATTSPTSIPATSSSKLDKAKSTCTELGFTLGTEKHGECVLKMMDK